MMWYKTESFEYVSHTAYEVVLQYRKNKNVKLVYDFTWLTNDRKRIAVYDKNVFMVEHKVLSLAHKEQPMIIAMITLLRSRIQYEQRKLNQ